MEWFAQIAAWVYETVSLENETFFRFIVTAGLLAISTSAYETYDEIRYVRGLLQDEFKRGPKGGGVENEFKGSAAIPDKERFHSSNRETTEPAKSQAGRGRDEAPPVS